MKYCFAGDALTYDYNWEWGDGAKFAEICLCGSKNCRAFIAKVSPSVMKRSIPRYVAILNEMETHNIYESQRLDRLQAALHNNRTMTTQEKTEVQHLKRDNEELRLTKRKALLLKKGILIAKAKLTELENLENIERNKLESESNFSHYQALPDDEDNDNDVTIDTRFSKAKLHQSRSADLPDSNDELDSTSIDTSQNSRTFIPNSLASSYRGETSKYMDNIKEHCVTESRISQALKNEGLPLSIKIPLPIKNGDKCVLMGVKDIDQLIMESKLASESLKRSSSRKCIGPSCISPTQAVGPNIRENEGLDFEYSTNTPNLRQYDSAMRTNRQAIKGKETTELEETPSRETPSESVGSTSLLASTYMKETMKNAEDWGEGLFTQDEINRVFSWSEGTIHARGESSQFQPWPKAKKWAYWLHKNFRHPKPIELEIKEKTWVGISTNTLRAGPNGGTPTARSLPLVRDVRTLLSDVLTFIPYKYSGDKLVESKKSGNIWQIVWSDPIEPLPGNPKLQEAG